MKLTRSQLKRIIKEAILEQGLSEDVKNLETAFKALGEVTKAKELLSPEGQKALQVLVDEIGVALQDRMAE